jgi:hypothetical protein
VRKEVPVSAHSTVYTQCMHASEQDNDIELVCAIDFFCAYMHAYVRVCVRACAGHAHNSGTM